MTSIGILQTGVVPLHLVERHGPYDGMMRRMLGNRYSYRTYDVEAGELPVRPEDHAAYIITGSPAGVYDPLPWIEPLKAFIRSAQGRAKLVGICFGHQIMAEALGGRVEKSPKGWGLGLHHYDVKAWAPWMDDRGRVSVAASHQDQVVIAPEGATVLAASAFTPYAILSYAGGDAVSFQFHPEFDRTFAEALVDLKRSSFVDPSDVERTLATLQAPSDAPRVAAWIRRFIDAA